MTPAIDPTDRLRLIPALCFVLVLVVSHGAAYLIGRSSGQATAAVANAAAVQHGYQAEVRRKDQDIERGQSTGKAAIRAVQKADQFYQRLNQEARDDAHASIDDFELPADRLQRWRDANAGPFANPAAAQPDSGTGNPSAASVGQAERPGGQSP